MSSPERNEADSVFLGKGKNCLFVLLQAVRKVPNEHNWDTCVPVVFIGNLAYCDSTHEQAQRGCEWHCDTVMSWLEEAANGTATL